MTDSLDLSTVLAVDAAVTRSSGSAGFGVTESGFLPKPFTRLLAEKIALARELIDPDIDLSSGSVVRKLLEISALEDARTWEALGAAYDDSFVVSASRRALTELGDELGLPRPFRCAEGSVALTLGGALPEGMDALVIPRGVRLTTLGGHRIALAATVRLSAALPSASVPVVSFDPGPVGDLDPSADDGSGTFPQRIDRWEAADAKLSDMWQAEAALALPPGGLVTIAHTAPLTGGTVPWSDTAYRALLLRAPRGLWSVDAMSVAVSLVPGVRQVVVRDGWGGLDLSHSVFGNFDFIERLFAADRDLAAPYYVTVLVAATDAAIWAGQGGLEEAVESALRDVRPVGVFPHVAEATQVYTAVRAEIVTRGLTLPPGASEIVNASSAALALKERLIQRLHDVVDRLSLGEPVRTSAVMHALMSEPGVVDVCELRLVRAPSELDAVGSGRDFDAAVQVLGNDENLTLTDDQIAVLVDRPDLLVVR